MENHFTTYYQSPIGLIRLFFTEHHLSELHFLDTIRKPPAEHHKNNSPPLALQALEELIGYFNGELRQFSVPIRQEGTPFQQQVWEELFQIPFGKTISYLELAKRSGDPKSIRAVAAANGKNKLAIVVPCHRVIGSKNDLVGYAGGLWRKKWLLDHENRIANGVQMLF